MRKTTTALSVAILVLAVGSGTAVADPPSQPSAPPPVPAPLALYTLTTIPDGWQNRVDLRPQLEVFSDGKAVKSPDAVAVERAPDVPPKQTNGHIPPEVLTSALAETRSLAAVDLGVPKASDESSQIIDYMPQPPGEDVHLVVYAPQSTDGLDAEQQAGRKRFADLYTKLLDAFVQDN
jgi:hypothetical protein